MVDVKGRIFFAIFFVAIIASIAFTYYKIEILQDYRMYRSDEVIPEPTDFYKDLFSRFNDVIR